MAGRVGAAPHRQVQVWLALASMLLAAACTRDGNPGEQPATSAPATQRPSVFLSPPDAGEVRVAETGLSSWDNGFSTLVSYGVVIENTSEAVAQDILVSVWLTDNRGSRIVNQFGQEEPWLVERLAHVLPGQQLGLGSTEVLGDREEPTRLEVESEGPDAWEGFVDSYWLHQPVKTNNVVSEHREQGTLLSFTVEAAYTHEMLPAGARGVRPSFVAIFRDSGRTIVGGDNCCGRGFIPPGRSQQELRLGGRPPPRTDDSQTEIYLVS